METWVGIDISKDTFDAAWKTESGMAHEKFPNAKTGFKQLLKVAPSDAKFVMESTGTYHMNCAMYLTACDRHVSVENSLAVKRHIQSDLKRCKSDKSDAISIAKYGREKRPEPWHAPSEEARKARRCKALMDKFQVAITMMKNLLHAFNQEDMHDDALKICKAALRELEASLSKAEKAFEDLVCKRWGEEVKIISSIPGVGKASACHLVAKVEDFTRFETSRQYLSWLGMTPRNLQSGTCIHVRGGITKMGDSRLRTQFYMCAVASISFNRKSREMWERMRAKGKPAKVAFVAIENKLLKTAFALVTKREMYSESFT